MSQDAATYVTRLEAALRRLGSGKEQTRDILEEVYETLARGSDDDLAAVLGPAEQYAEDALAGRRPPRSRYLRRLGTELTIRGLPGERAGQVLAEVAEHLRDSGGHPAEAFGTPAEYAQQVVEAVGSMPAHPARPGQRLLLALCGTSGTLLAIEGLVALTRGLPATLTAGLLGAALVLPLVSLGVGLLALRKPRLGIAAMPVAAVGSWFGQLAALAWLRGPTLAEVPAYVAVAVGLTLLGALLATGRGLAAGSLPEPVVDPRPGADPHPAFDTAERRESVVRGIAWGSAAVLALEVGTLTVAVLLLT